MIGDEADQAQKPPLAARSERMPTKYILVTGGVISGIGKGVIASSTGLLLKTQGLRVTSIKIDPYLNIDAGTLSPLDHGERREPSLGKETLQPCSHAPFVAHAGEVFVLEDGGEVDLDLGNYERFLDVQLTRHNNITTGKVYRSVIEREVRNRCFFSFRAFPWTGHQLCDFPRHF